MTGHMNGFQLCIAEMNLFAVFHIMPQRNSLLVGTETEHTALVRQFLQQKLIFAACLRFQSEFAQKERIAENMIQMQVRIQQMLDGQLVFADIFFQHLLLLRIITSGIDNRSFPCFVREHITVDGKHVEFKAFYLHFIFSVLITCLQ